MSSRLVDWNLRCHVDSDNSPSSFPLRRLANPPFSHSRRPFQFPLKPLSHLFPFHPCPTSSRPYHLPLYLAHHLALFDHSLCEYSYSVASCLVFQVVLLLKPEHEH